MEPIRLRTFLEEATIIEGGSHDGMSAEIRYKHAMDDLVIAHENIHHEIFTLYPDGQLLGLLLASQNESIRNEIGENIDGKFGSITDQVFSSSEFAHEVFATYLSIKRFNFESQEYHLGRYSEDYQVYYRHIAEVLDSIFESRELQYIVALALGCMTFSSPFVLRFLRQLPQVVANLDASEMANKRLDGLLEVFGDESEIPPLLTELQAVGRRKALELGIEPWDLQSNTGWRACPAWALDKFNNVLGEYIGDWIQERTTVVMCYEYIEKTRLLTQFTRFLGRDIETFSLDGSGDLSREEVLILLDASKASKSTITSDVFADPLKGEVLFQYLHISHQMAIGATSIDDTELDFIARSPNEMIPAVCARISDKILQKRSWQWQIASGVTADIRPWIKAAVFGVHAPGDLIQWWNRMHHIGFLPERVEDVSSPRSGKIFKVFMYLHGDYDEWIKLFEKPLHYTTLRFESKLFQRGGCIVKILTAFPGGNLFYMRMFSNTAEDSLGRYESLMIERGELVKMTDSDEDMLYVTAACNLCVTMWPSL